jgi:hypothetical protein
MVTIVGVAAARCGRTLQAPDAVDRRGVALTGSKVERTNADADAQPAGSIQPPVNHEGDATVPQPTASSAPSAPPSGTPTPQAGTPTLTGTWTRIATTNAPSERTGHAFAWSGCYGLPLGGVAANGAAAASLAIYDPRGNVWTSLGDALGADAVLGSAVIYRHFYAFGAHAAGRTLAEATLATTPITAPVAPMVACDGRATVTAAGPKAVYWTAAQGASCQRGLVYDAMIDAWGPLPDAGAPTARGAQAVALASDVAGDNATQAQLVVWGGVDAAGAPVASGARIAVLPVVGDAWRPIAAAGAPTPRRGFASAWTDRELFVWGGCDGAGDGACDAAASAVATGGLYNPETDTWRAVSTDGAPTLKARAVAAWTGRQVVVFDGTNGAAYDPASGVWRALPTTDAPQLRDGGALAWTGSALIAWGASARSGHTGEAEGAQLAAPELTPAVATANICYPLPTPTPTATPAPTATPDPDATPAPGATATPTPEATPTPTPVALPTATPTPDVTPTPTPTPDGAPTPTPTPSPTPHTHTIFVTSTTSTGGFGGTSAADTKCANAAKNGNLAGTFHALISTQFVQAKDRVMIKGNVYNTHDELIATTSFDLWDKFLHAKVAYDEKGVGPIPKDVWTGSNADGTRTTNTCANWTAFLNTSSADFGSTNSTLEAWFHGSSTKKCDQMAALYCLSE